MNSYQKLWNKEKEIIIGSNLFTSKRCFIFPQYKYSFLFSKSKGFLICDLNSIKLIDKSILGIVKNFFWPQN